MAIDSITFSVVGVPAPQGSKSAFVRGGRAVIVDGSSKTGRDKHAQWRADVTQAARVAAQGHTFTGPVEVRLRFTLSPVKSDPHRHRHTTSPDLDKLVRSVLDSLTNSGIIRDDSLVFEVVAGKYYALAGEPTGVSVHIVDWASFEDAHRALSKERARDARKSVRS